MNELCGLSRPPPFVVIGNSLKDVIPLWSAIFCLGIQTRDVVLSSL